MMVKISLSISDCLAQPDTWWLRVPYIMFDSAWDMMVKIALRMITLITLATQLETWWWRSANDFDFMRPIMELGVTLVTIHPAMAKKLHITFWFSATRFLVTNGWRHAPKDLLWKHHWTVVQDSKLMLPRAAIRKGRTSTTDTLRSKACCAPGRLRASGKA